MTKSTSESHMADYTYYRHYACNFIFFPMNVLFKYSIIKTKIDQLRQKPAIS